MNVELIHALKKWITDSNKRHNAAKEEISKNLSRLGTFARVRNVREDGFPERVRRRVIETELEMNGLSNLILEGDGLYHELEKEINSILGSEHARSLSSEVYSAFSSPSRTGLRTSSAADLAREYNDDPASMLARRSADSFGAANASALLRGASGPPDLQVMEGGMFRIIRDGEDVFVVPRPKLRLDEALYRCGGTSHLFECPGLTRETLWEKVRLISPAVVRRDGSKWTVIQKGELRSGLASGPEFDQDVT
jgi:hypothetical protein